MKRIYPKPTKELLFETLYIRGLTPKAASIALGISHLQLRKVMMEYDLSARTVAIQMAREVRNGRSN